MMGGGGVRLCQLCYYVCQDFISGGWRVGGGGGVSTHPEIH